MNVHRKLRMISFITLKGLVIIRSLLTFVSKFDYTAGFAQFLRYVVRQHTGLQSLFVNIIYVCIL